MLSRRRFLTAASTLAAGTALPVGLAHTAPAGGRAPSGIRPVKNVVLMIPDGFGVASATFARMATGRRLALDTFVTGQVGTQSSDSFVTDSAAGGTALACGLRTYNGAIALDDDRRPVASLLEAAQARGLRTGLVTTTRITHATPAVFAAHVPSRAMELTIAEQMLATAPDVLLGGGSEYFLPEPEGRRTDGRDLVAEARAAGYRVVRTERELASASGRVLGLFAESHMAYELDRAATEQPSLATMTRRALALLDNPDGFFVMVEGGRIDHAGHGNDAAAHLHDVLAYDDAVAEALAFAEADGETLVVSVADHETGGLSIGRDGQYRYDPAVLLDTTASAEGLSEALRAAHGDARPPLDAVEALLLAHAPVEALTDDERARLATAVEAGGTWEPARTMAGLVGARAFVGWTTGGHTGEDVLLHAFGPGSERLSGFMENYEVALALADLLAVDLDAATERLRASIEVPVE